MSKFIQQSRPLDVFLGSYFRSHRAVGSKDRRFLSEAIYDWMRWKGLIEYLGVPPHPFDPSPYLAREDIPKSTRLSCPLPLFELLLPLWGEEKTSEFCLTCNSRAPLTLRANHLKISRDSLLEKWRDKWEVSPCLESSCGIHFHERINLALLPEFKEGLFEVQDEGSQLIAQLIEAKRGDRVLDFCAGSGGKTLALAPAMQNKGVVFLHDIRPASLKRARERLKRAGLFNVQFNLPKKGSVNWILVDVPCTGSGTWRRNPDMKWKFTPALLHRLAKEQREIFAQALTYLHPKGKIVYATCSIFPQENEEQVAYFQEQFHLSLIHQRLPLVKQGGMDGFFGAVLTL